MQKQSKFNLFIYQSGVEFSGESNKIVFNAVSPVSFMQIRLKTHFYNQIILPLLGNLSGQNKVLYQILAYYIEKWPIYSLPRFGNYRRTLLYWKTNKPTF